MSEIDFTARIHPRAVVAEQSFRIGANVSIGPNAVIHKRVTIEDEVCAGHGVMFTKDLYPAATNADRSLRDAAD